MSFEFCDLSVKIAPDLKKKSFRYEKFQKLGVIFNFSLKKWGLWVTVRNFVKNMGSLGEIVKIYGVLVEGDAKKWGS